MDQSTPTFASRITPKGEWYEHSYHTHPSRLVRVAFSIAEEAHRRHDRDTGMSYITHVTMVCKLLEMMGKADEINLAIALLHDVKEDAEPYKSTPGALREELVRRLHDPVHSGSFTVRDARNIASYIDNACSELTNARDISGNYEDKRTFQVMHAQRMSDQCKLIKTLDQAASTMDDIFHESSRSKAKIERFAMKGINIANATSQGMTDEVRLAAHMYKNFFRYLINLHGEKDPEEIKKLRDRFDPRIGYEHAKRNLRQEINALRERALLRETFAAEDRPEIEILHPALRPRGSPELNAALDSGCVKIRIETGRDGKPWVTSYNCLIDKIDTSDDNLRNRAAIYLYGAIESFAAQQHVAFKEPELHNNRLTRKYEVDPPITLAEFLEATKKAKQVLCGYMEEEYTANTKMQKPDAQKIERAILDSVMQATLKSELNHSLQNSR